MTHSQKDWIQYGSALLLLLSGVLLAVLSFFLNDYDITDGVLWYIAQALVYAGSAFGINVYIRTKLGDIASSAKNNADAKDSGTECA